MNIKVNFDNIKVQESKTDFTVKILMLKGEKGDTGDVSLSQLNAETTARKNADNNLQSQITGLASGSPLVASSTSEMTDTTRIYVLTTNGHWYWYNGSTWEDGGVYQATSNQDQIDDILDNISRVNKEYKIANVGYDDETFIKNGEVKTASNYLAVKYVPIKPGCDVVVDYVGYNATNRQICMYDESYTYIGNATVTVIDTYISNTLFKVSFTAPNNCYYIRFSINNELEGVTMLNSETFHYTLVNTSYNYTEKLYQKPLNKIPLFVFTFDRSGDNVFTDDYNTGSTIDGIMSEYGFKYTVATQVNSSGNIILSSTNAKILENKGCDLCIYSSYQNPYTEHNDDPDVYTDTSYSDEWKAHFEYAINKLKSIGVYNPTAWCSRWNKYGIAMKQPLIDCGFLICRGNNVSISTTMADRQVENFNEFSLDIPTSTITSGNLSDFLNVIDSCIINKNDYIITTHELRANDADAEANFTMTPTKLRTLCAYLKNLQDDGKCRIVTMREYAELRMANRGYDNNYRRLMNKINNTEITI